MKDEEQEILMSIKCNRRVNAQKFTKAVQKITGIIQKALTLERKRHLPYAWE